jgi:hypothetical protein
MNPPLPHSHVLDELQAAHHPALSTHGSQPVRRKGQITENKPPDRSMRTRTNAHVSRTSPDTKNENLQTGAN